MAPLELAGAALRLDSALFREAATGRLWDEALLLLLLAGASQALGQALVLFVNRVPPRRFVAALAMNALLHAAGVAVTALGMVAAARGLGLRPPPGALLALIGLAQAPYLLALFSVIPHLGLVWQRLLEAWVFAGTVAALTLGLGIDFGLAALVAGLEWGVTHLLSALLGPAVGLLPGRLRTWATGRRLDAPGDLVAGLRAKAAAPIAPVPPA